MLGYTFLIIRVEGLHLTKTFLSVCLGFLATASIANAGMVEWTGVVDNSWEDTRNWTPVAPSEDDSVLLRSGSKITVHSDGNIVKEIAMNAGSSLEIAESGTLTMSEPSLGAVLAGSTINHGAMYSLGGFLVNEGRFKNTGILQVQTFQVSNDSGSFTNEGTVEAGILESFGGTNDNSGTIDSDVIQLAHFDNSGLIYSRQMETGSFRNTGSVQVESLLLRDNVQNYGLIEVSSLDAQNRGLLANYGVINTGYTTGISYIENYGQISGDGIERVHEINNFGSLTLRYGLADRIINSGHISISGAVNWFYVENSGTIESNGFANWSDVVNSGTIESNGSANVASLDNSQGRFINRGEMYLQGQEISGVFVNEGLLDITALDVFNFNGAFFGGGTITTFPDTVITFNELLSLGADELDVGLIALGDDNLLTLDLLASGSTGAINADRMDLGGTLRLNLDGIGSLSDGLIFELFSAREIAGDFINLQFDVSNSGFKLVSDRYFADGLWHYRLQTVRDVSAPQGFLLVLLGLLFSFRRETK